MRHRSHYEILFIRQTRETAAVGADLVIVAGGQFLASTMPIADSTLTSLVVPIGGVGISFALAVASITPR